MQPRHRPYSKRRPSGVLQATGSLKQGQKLLVSSLEALKDRPFKISCYFGFLLQYSSGESCAISALLSLPEQQEPECGACSAQKRFWIFSGIVVEFLDSSRNPTVRLRRGSKRRQKEPPLLRTPFFSFLRVQLYYDPVFAFFIARFVGITIDGLRTVSTI